MSKSSSIGKKNSKRLMMNNHDSAKRSLGKSILFLTLSILILITITLNSASSLFAQGMDNYGGGAKIKLNESGSHYIRFITWVQMWARYQELNPGSSVNGMPSETSTDLGMRRGRFLAFGEFGKGSLFLFHIGINNQTWLNGGAPGEGTGPGKKPQVFIHDFWYEQKIVDKALSMGVGLHYWWGISREANASTLNFLALDAPIYNWPEIEATDQFARQFGVYFKGKIEQLDYRIMVNKPFRPSTVVAPDQVTAVAYNDKIASFNGFANTWSFGGYFSWQFWDQESNLLPFTVGTYLGTKKVFNIGAGFYFHPKGSATRKAQSVIDALPAGTVSTPNTAGFNYENFLTTHNQLLIGVDVFLDLPFGEGEEKSALTTYGVFYKYDFGPNYFRNVGIMNFSTGITGATSFNGAGNAYPLIGTGNLFRVETGYLLSSSVFNFGGRLQPFATANFMKFDRLKDAGLTWELGANYLIEGHHAKYSFLWRQRPIYTTVTGSTDGPDGLTRVEKTDSRGELIVQAMVYF
ncbi:MAG: hypothetical protein SFU91_14425 [Chloroherpetonaceae bacterium]|nr:hypothetical protein [Chloroherpetonaceae bacterium]